MALNNLVQKGADISLVVVVFTAWLGKATT